MRLSKLCRATSLVGRKVDGLLTATARRLQAGLANGRRSSSSDEEQAGRATAAASGSGGTSRPGARRLSRCVTIVDSCQDCVQTYPVGEWPAHCGSVE